MNCDDPYTIIYRTIVDNIADEKDGEFLSSFDPLVHKETLWTLYCAIQQKRNYVERGIADMIVSRDEDGLINSSEGRRERNTIALRKEPLHCIRFVCGNSYKRRIAHKLASLVGLYSKKSHEHYRSIEILVCKYHGEEWCKECRENNFDLKYSYREIIAYRPHTTVSHVSMVVAILRDTNQCKHFAISNSNDIPVTGIATL